MKWYLLHVSWLYLIKDRFDLKNERRLQKDIDRDD